MIRLFVRQGVRVGKQRGMQDRHLTAAEHGNGEQRRDHDMFDDPLHDLSKPVCSRLVKRTAVVKDFPPSFVRQSRVGMYTMPDFRRMSGTCLQQYFHMRKPMTFDALLKGSVFALAAVALAGPAMAHGFDDCTKEPKDKWKPQAEAEAAATAAGYTVTKSKVEGSCYEVYAKDKDGKKFELFYNPVDLQLVKKQDD